MKIWYATYSSGGSVRTMHVCLTEEAAQRALCADLANHLDEADLDAIDPDEDTEGVWAFARCFVRFLEEGKYAEALQLYKHQIKVSDWLETIEIACKEPTQAEDIDMVGALICAKDVLRDAECSCSE